MQKLEESIFGCKRFPPRKLAKYMANARYILLQALAFPIITLILMDCKLY
jgi:hypothetical protein